MGTNGITGSPGITLVSSPLLPPSSWCCPVRQVDPSQFLQGGDSNGGLEQERTNTLMSFVFPAQLTYASAAVNKTVQDDQWRVH